MAIDWRECARGQPLLDPCACEFRLGDRRLALGACLAATLLPAQAALTVSTTRIVFDSDKRSTSVVIANPSPRPYAVQTWINTSKDDTDTPVPLATSPGLFRLDPRKEQMVQISRLPNTLPKDRETLFYLNVQEIPEARRRR
jgi:P pilus assembly chaperone PapD